MRNLFIEGRPYDSYEEYYFELWLLELRDAGYIESFEYQPDAFELSDSIFYKVETPLKTKMSHTDYCLMRGKEYTADFKIHWNKCAHGTFYVNLPILKKKATYEILAQDDVSYIDVKGDFDRDGSHTMFEILRKWTFQKFGIFVNKVMPVDFKECLFAKTFTPTKYDTVTKRGKPRKLHFKPRSLVEFVALINTDDLKGVTDV